MLLHNGLCPVQAEAVCTGLPRPEEGANLLLLLPGAVEKIEIDAMYAEKSWGSYTVIDVQPGSMTVKLSMRVGESLSYHYHNHREEVWTVVSGKGKAMVDGMEQILRTGDVITISAGCKHTVQALTTLDIIEVQLGEEISEHDKINVEM